MSKETHIQAGFDEGYSLGAEIGVKAGSFLGVLEGICQAVGRLDREQYAGLVEEVNGMCKDAREELKVEKLLSPDYFGPDGIWLFQVPGEGEGEEGDSGVTFRDVADRHPVMMVWRERLEKIAAKVGIRLET